MRLNCRAWALRPSGLDGLGQQPFGPFLADPFAPPAQRRGIDGRAVPKKVSPMKY
jgi:hypothetical protein